MARVEDVVAFLLEQSGTITTYKLQNLLYYVQGWSLAWDGAPLFDAKIKACQDGPCVGVVFHGHRGQRHVSRWPQGDPSQLDEDARDTVRAVLEMYGDKTPEELVAMTHDESPWKDTWSAGPPSPAREITVDALRAFFVPLAEREAAPPTEKAAAMASRLTAFLDATARGDTGR